MYQIDNSTAAVALPASTAPGVAGYFTDGDPAGGQAATVLPAEFMNALMLEQLNVLAAAGIAPAKASFNQLALAIKTIVQTGATTYAVDSGAAANTYVLALSPAITAYTASTKVRGVVGHTNTGASTLDAGAGPKPLVGLAHSALQGGEMFAGGYFEAQYSPALSKFILLWCTGAPEQMAAGTASGHAVTLAQLQSGSSSFAIDSGTTNAIVANLSPAPPALTDGMLLRVLMASGNNGPVTLTINGYGPFGVRGLAGLPLQGGELALGGRATFLWAAASSVWILLSCQAGALQVAPGLASSHATTIGQLQSGYGLYAYDTGGANTYVASYTPAITAITDGMVLKFKAANANTGAATFNPNGLGAKPILGAAHSALQAGEIVAGGDVWLQWNSSIGAGSWILIDSTGGGLQVPPATQTQHAIQFQQMAAIRGAFKNLAASSTGLSAAVSVTADELTVESAANTYLTLRNVSVNPTFASAGANGLDVGAANSQAASTWYSVWVIWNGATTAGLLSLSATAPTLPGGYTHAARVGWVKTDATANKYPLSFIQSGRRVQFKVAAGSNVTTYPVMASSAVSLGITAIGVSGFVPPTASAISVGVTASTSSTVAQTVVYASAAGVSVVACWATSVVGSSIVQATFSLEGPNIYWYFMQSTSGNGSISCLGWEDNI